MTSPFRSGMAALALAMVAMRWTSPAPRGSSIAPQSVQPSPGYSYTLTVTNDPPSVHPDMLGGPGQERFIAHAQVTPGRGRLDIVEGQSANLFAKGDYLLVDSAEMVVVHPAAQTFVLLSREMRNATDQLSANGVKTNVSEEKITLDSVGPGEPIAGFPTTRYRMTLGFNLEVQGPVAGGRIGSEAVTDYWVANIPGMPNNLMLRSNGGTVAMPTVMRALSDRVDSATARLGHVVVLRSSSVTKLTIAPGQVLESHSALEVSDVHRATVDQRLLIVPADYKVVSVTDASAEVLGDGAKWKALPPGR